MKSRIDLTEFRKRSDLESAAVVLAHLSLVVFPLFLAAWLGPHPFWVVLWVLFGFLMNGILNLMHECSHFHLFRGRRGSDLVGRWIVGPLLLADFDGYRDRHWKHHIHLGTDDDTKDAYLVNIQGNGAARLLINCLMCRLALRKFELQGSKSGERSKIWMMRTVMVQSLLVLCLILVAGPMAGRPLRWATLISTGLCYVLIYLYGLASITVFAATLRAIAEHQLEEGEQSTTGRAALRNFRCGPLGRLFFGAYGFAEHATHHLEPALPYYHLRTATIRILRHEASLKPERNYIGEIVRLAQPARQRTVSK